jgi:predicted ATPase
MAADLFVVISGCSGGGKSTLLAELARRGHRVVEEPGRRIVAQELQRGGTALPWINPVAFAKRVVNLARDDRQVVKGAPGWTFFDRGLIDAAVALEHLTGAPIAQTLGADRYNDRVFLAPPWPAIYVNDPERRHGLSEAMAEYDRLAAAYPSLGYKVIRLPLVSVAERADLVLAKTLTPPAANGKAV